MLKYLRWGFAGGALLCAGEGLFHVLNTPDVAVLRGGFYCLGMFLFLGFVGHVRNLFRLRSQRPAARPKKLPKQRVRSYAGGGDTVIDSGVVAVGGDSGCSSDGGGGGGDVSC